MSFTITKSTPKHRILARLHTDPALETRIMATRRRSADPDQIAALDRALAIIDATAAPLPEDPAEIAGLILSGRITRRQAEAIATDEQFAAIQQTFTLHAV